MFSFSRTPHLFLGLFVFGVVLLGVIPTTARAQIFVPVFDQAVTANTASIVRSTAALEIKEFSLDMVAYAAVQAAKNALMNSMLAWVKNGFQGNPTFIDNPSAFFTDIANNAGGGFLENLGLADICSSFRFDINIKMQDLNRILNDIDSNTSNRRTIDLSQCTLDDSILGGNIFAYQNDFALGGWDALLETALPRGNPMGLGMIQEGLLLQERAKAKEEAQKVADQGQGFIFRECAERSQSGAFCNVWNVLTPGTNIADQVNRVTGGIWDQFVAADELNELVGAAFQALTQRVFSNSGLLRA
jgi:hypothetical protein